MKKREDPLQQLQKARLEAMSNRKVLIERMRAKQANLQEKAPDAESPEQAQSKFHQLDVQTVIHAAEELRLMSVDAVAEVASLNRPTMELLREFFEVLRTRQTSVILQWPHSPRDVSYLHPLAMLALLCASPTQVSKGFSWCERAPTLRTLYFPWRGGATSTQQHSLLVRRSEILNRNKYHLTRREVEESSFSDLRDKFHLTLGHLNDLKSRDRTKPHLAHPTLGEMYPVFIADGENGTYFKTPANDLFLRVQFGAGLKAQTDYRPAICVPDSAPYGFYAVSSSANIKRALAAGPMKSATGRAPDICLLDLGQPALTRLGLGWEKVVEDFVNELAKRHPEVPVLAVTQDTYIQRRLEKILRQGKKTRPRSTVIIRTTNNPIEVDPPIAITSQTEASFAVVTGATSDAIAALSEAARGSSDLVLAGFLRKEIGSIRRASSMPCGLADAYNFLCEAVGQAQAEAFLDRRSRATFITPISIAIDSGVAGTERSRLVVARDAVNKAFDVLDKDTPVGSFLDSLIDSVLRKSSWTVVAFASETDLLLGERRLCSDPENGTLMRKRLDKGQVALVSAQNLGLELSKIEASGNKNSWKRLMLVAPSIEWLSATLVRAWLPEELYVLCERNLASRMGQTLGRLAEHPSLSGAEALAQRLKQVRDAANKEIEARAVQTLDLELDERPITTTSESVIDLTEDDGDEDGGTKLSIGLTSGRQMRARPFSVLVRYNKNAEFNPFERALAKDLKAGDTVVVPDSEFESEVRAVVPIKVLAEGWLDVYHATVQASLAQVPGDSLSAKTRWIHGKIQSFGARTQSQQAVAGWLKVEEYKQLPPDQRQPHAPQALREFNAFMQALSVPEQLSEKMWQVGIQQLRINRRRAGLRMGQAFVSVLVDPHGTASGLGPEVREGIAQLTKRAVEHLDEVSDLKMIEAR